MAPQNYQLVMRSGPNPGKTYELAQSVINIGRDITNDLVINDAEVSRKHARLSAQGGGYVLEDLGSTNGTFVNGQRLMGPHMLRPGELILFGENVSLVYEPMQYDPDATIAAAPNLPPATPVQPSPVEVYPEPQPASRAAPSPLDQPEYAPAYSGQVPPGPVETYPVEEERPNSNRNWFLAGCGCLVILACLALVAFLFWVDSGGTARWCQYFSFIFPSCP